MSDDRFRLMVTGKVAGAPELDDWLPDNPDPDKNQGPVPLCRFRVKIAKVAPAGDEKPKRMPEIGDIAYCTAWGNVNADYAESLIKGDYVGVIGIAKWGKDDDGRDYCNVNAKGAILLKRNPADAHDAKTREQKQREREQELAAKRAERQAAKEAAEEAARRKADAQPPLDDGLDEDIPF